MPKSKELSSSNSDSSDTKNLQKYSNGKQEDRMNAASQVSDEKRLTRYQLKQENDQISDKVSEEDQRSTKRKRKYNMVKAKESVISPKKSLIVKQENLTKMKDPQNLKCVGAHVSISGGLYKAVDRAVSIGAKAFGVFLKSQRKWDSKPLEDADAQKFRDACKEQGFSPNDILPHGSYLMNCGSPEEDTLLRSRNALVDELQRCEKLGLTLYNFHPGSTCGKISVEESTSRIAESINVAHQATKYAITVIENMSCQGNTIGGKFEELRWIIDLVQDKSRIGICLDTCHAFAAGYDLSTKEGYELMMTEFDKIVGIQYLKAMHLNDSKGKLACHLDGHENIGRGHIGKVGFQCIMKDPRLNGIPMILETPCQQGNTHTEEISFLYKLSEDT